MEISKPRLILIVLLPFCIAFIIGFSSGFFPFRTSNNSSNNNNTNNDTLLNYYETLIKDINKSYTQIVIDEINSDNIRNYLRDLTSTTHLAGTSGDLSSAQYVYDKWKSQGLDYVKLIDYDVLLSYPDPIEPNSLEIRNSNNELIQQINITEPIIDKELNYSGAPFPFLAYGPNGTVTSDEVYYVNYGTEDDYKVLKNNNINITGKIVICKYGIIFRGDKVSIAANHGAKGILLYDDPARSAPNIAKNQIYPNGEFLPEEGVQRGSILNVNGDPQTPMYPSISTAYRLKPETLDTLPSIIAQVIGYKYAQKIFEMMDGNKEVIDDSWKGAMNVTYTYGGKLKNNQTLTINVKNQQKVSKLYNVIGIIEGTTEPNRYVLFGNHRDAWVFGSLDPTSGTATMLEVSRALTSIRKTKGWTPKRSIVFLSWSGEEYGLIGSTEWVEEFNKKLTANSVSYLNMDISVQGNYSFVAVASPLLFDLILNVTKTIKVNDNETVFDRWTQYAPNENKTMPRIRSSLGSGSDYMAFQQRIGIPSLDGRYYHDKSDKYKLVGTSYPLYHTSYETFKLVEEFIDPGFKSFKTIATVMAELARALTDSLILPFNCRSYSIDMIRMFKSFNQSYGDTLKNRNIGLDGLNAAITRFSIVADKFHARLESIDRTKIHLINEYNEQMRNLEKAFLDPRGINRKGYMHMLTSTSLFNQYAATDFPGLTDATDLAIAEPTDDNWETVKLELSVVIYVINSATSMLDFSNSFERNFN